MNVTSYIIDNCKTEDYIIDTIIDSDTTHIGGSIIEYTISNNGDANAEFIGGSIIEYTISNDCEANANASAEANDATETTASAEFIGGLLTNTTESECTNEGKTCSSTRTINLMSKFIKSNNNVIEKIENELKCDTESCVLTHPAFSEFVRKETGNLDVIKQDLYVNFKTKGPRNNTDLLNNFNIDDTLLRWGREFREFYPCPFSMIDFKTVDSEFGCADLYKVFSGQAYYKDPINGEQEGPFNTYGCVLNTDVSTGRGKHWVCMFVDCRSSMWTIEYFNSSGNPPHIDVTEWMETQRNKLLKIHDNVETITVTNIVHQKSNTECGMYVLYYIRSRLDGVDYKHFLSKRIDDSEVTKFRKHVFRKY